MSSQYLNKMTIIQSALSFLSVNEGNAADSDDFQLKSKIHRKI